MIYPWSKQFFGFFRGAFILLISLQVVSTDLYRLVPSSIDLKSQKEGTLWRKTKNLTVCENY